MTDFSYAIVGAGIHGTHITNKLLRDTGLEKDDVVIFDPEGYGEVFENRTSSCKTDYLRSPEVHHVGKDPWDLKTYAQSENRTEELTSREGKPNRPSTDLFIDHLEYVVKSNSMDELLVESYVERLYEEEELVLETLEDTYTAENVVFALGEGKPNYPDFADSLPSKAPLNHVFEPAFNPQIAAEYEGETVVVGGSITAGQLAGYLGENCEGDVTMLSRSPLEIELIEADPVWLNSSYLENNLHSLETAEERYEKIREERFDGTMPDYVWNDIEECLEQETLEIVEDKIELVEYCDGSLDAETKKGRSFEDARIVLATGFEPPHKLDFVEETIENLDLQTTDNRELPVLDDDSLRWFYEDGEKSDLRVSGKLAETSIGPFAGNIAGARMGATRILQSYEEPKRRFLKP